MNTDAGNAPRSTPPSRTGKRIALALVIVWVAIIVGLYTVLAKLKMGGAEALRSGTTQHGASAEPSGQ